MTQNIHLARFIQHMLNGDHFDPEAKDLSKAARAALLNAGDNIEDVLTKTLDAIEASEGQVVVRNIDLTATRALVERQRFWESLVSALEVIHRMARDQELILESNLQRAANHLNRELQTYMDDPLRAQDFKDLKAYMTRGTVSRRRNQRLIDRALEAAEAAEAAKAAEAAEAAEADKDAPKP